jgi:hypothetical protein
MKCPISGVFSFGKSVVDGPIQEFKIRDSQGQVESIPKKYLALFSYLGPPSSIVLNSPPYIHLDKSGPTVSPEAQQQLLFRPPRRCAPFVEV